MSSSWLQTLLSRLRKLQPKRPIVSAAHDIALIRQLRGNRAPSWRQFAHIRYILNPRERRWVLFGIVLFTAGILWLGGSIVAHYRTAVPAAGGQYTEAIVGSPKLVNPMFSFLNDADRDLMSLLFSGLMRYTENQELAPDLAESYTVSEDKKTYTFVLREGLTWHDGEPLTASDVAFTIETIQDPSIGSPLRISFQGAVVTAKDDRTIEVVLPEPFSAFVSSMTVGILPEHIWINIPREQMRLARENLRPVGNGPFQFKKLVKDDAGFIVRYELSRFEAFHRAPAFLKEIAFQFYTEYEGSQGPIQAIREQKADGLHFVPRALRESIARKHIRLFTLQLPQYTALFFNQKQQPLLEEKDIRLALAHALDKDRIMREGLEEDGRVIESPLLPGFPGYAETAPKIAYDVAAANQLLDAHFKRITAAEYRAMKEKEAIDRWKEEQKKSNGESAESPSENENANIPDDVLLQMKARLDQDIDPAQMMYRIKDNAIFELTLVTSESGEYVHTARLIASLWQEAGVKTTVKLVAPKDIAKDVLKKRAYDVLLYGMIVGSDPDQYPFWHSSQIGFPGLNLAQYINRNADTLLEQARGIADDQKRAELYGKFQELLLADMPVVFLYTPTYTYAQTDRIRGFAATKIAHPSDRFNGVTGWYVKTDGVWK